MTTPYTGPIVTTRSPNEGTAQPPPITIINDITLTAPVVIAPPAQIISPAAPDSAAKQFKDTAFGITGLLVGAPTAALIAVSAYNAAPDSLKQAINERITPTTSNIVITKDLPNKSFTVGQRKSATEPSVAEAQITERQNLQDARRIGNIGADKQIPAIDLPASSGGVGTIIALPDSIPTTDTTASLTAFQAKQNSRVITDDIRTDISGFDGTPAIIAAPARVGVKKP